MQRKGNISRHSCWSLWEMKPQQDRGPQEKAVIAQPVFVFERRDKGFKRPAEDALYDAAERECNGLSRKHLRPSCFTISPTDSRSQEAKKKSVFISSTLVQNSSHTGNTELGPVKHLQHILRPAILQPPQVQRWEKVPEETPILLSEKSSSTRVSAPLSMNQDFSGAASVGCHINEDKSSFKSYSSEFVFGENMVERILGIQKVSQSQCESDSYTMGQPANSALTSTINSPNSIMRNQGSLRLILNSKLFAQMDMQRANHKNLQIAATDLEDYSIKLFLIQASAKDIEYLYAAIHHLLIALRSCFPQKDVNQAENQSETLLQQLNCKSWDEDEDDFIQGSKNGSDPSRWTDREEY